MSVKKIKPEEEFQMHDRVFVYTVVNNNISIKFLRDAKKIVKKDFIPPTISEVVSYFKENGYSEEAAKKFHMSYSAGNPPWHDSQGKPVIAWKQKAINVWFKPENVIKKTEAPKKDFFKE